MEPFGGTDNFDINEKYVIYTTKDPDIPPAVHTRQNVRSIFCLKKLADVFTDLYRRHLG